MGTDKNVRQLAITNPRCIGDGNKVRDYIHNLGFQKD